MRQALTCPPPWCHQWQWHRRRPREASARVARGEARAARGASRSAARGGPRAARSNPCCRRSRQEGAWSSSSVREHRSVVDSAILGCHEVRPRTCSHAWPHHTAWPRRQWLTTWRVPCHAGAAAQPQEGQGSGPLHPARPGALRRSLTARRPQAPQPLEGQPLLCPPCRP